MEYSRQWQRAEPVRPQSAPELSPEVRRLQREAAADPTRGPAWWNVRAKPKPAEAVAPVKIDPAARVAAGAAADGLEAAQQWHRLIEQRLERTGVLLDRVRELDAVRLRPDLIEELDGLDPADPQDCLYTVAIVLAEALAMGSVPSPDERFDAWLSSLETLAGQAERQQHRVVVVPGADGTIQGRVPRRPVSGVQVRDSAAVMWGAHNRLDVTHLCMVERPVIEIADLVEMSEGGSVFDWSAWEYTSSTSSTAAAAGGYWTNIWNCKGVMIGNHNTMDVTYVYRMASCRVNLAPLLCDDRIRADLALCREDDGTPGKEEARRRLPKTVATVANTLDLSSLVSEDEIAAQAARLRRPRVGGGGRILISHGVGVAIGVNPEVDSHRRVKVGAIRVR